jgi:hypothetical protein
VDTETKSGSDALDVQKIADELRRYEESSARGGLKINVPLQDALRALARAKPESKEKRKPNGKK